MSDLPSRLVAALDGRYLVERELGAGGMATVYLAQDIRHDRAVALKVLKPELAAVMGAERFLSEIRTTANLQHPHILPLYDSGEADSFLFYVMPYVEGETLRERLAREKQLSVEETLRIAKAVGGALDFAHRKGVIHRDIKPANILLQDGQPLVADFGIALAVAQAGGGRLTETGLSLGTPHYMSPEQATADRDPDARSDIYSMACVVYEMLTGEPPHLGSSAQAVLARILTETPHRVRDTRPTVPTQVDATLAKALQKLPADRFDTAADFVAALEGRIAVDTGPIDAASARGEGSGAAHRPWLWPALAGGALVVGAAVGWVARAPKSPAPPPVVRMYVEGDSSYSVTNACCGPSVAISQDGKRIVFMARTSTGMMLYRRDLDDADAHAIPGTEEAHTPFLDPTGRWLGFVKNDRLMKTDLAGGTPLTIADVGTSRVWGAAWGDDGFVYFTPENQEDTSAIYRVSARGGGPERFSAPDTAVEAGRVSPAALPGGRGLLYVSWPKTGGDAAAWVSVLDLKDGSTHRLTPGIQPYYADGTLVHALADGSIMAQPFDLKSLHLSGDAARIGENVITHNASDTEYAISWSGTLVTRHGGGTGGGTVGTGGSMPVILGYDLTGAMVGQYEASGGTRLPRGMPTVSPNGKYIAVVQSKDDGASVDLWVLDRSTGLDALLSSGKGGFAVSPIWSADSREVRWIEYEDTSTYGLGPSSAFASALALRASKPQPMSRPVDLSGPAKPFAPEISPKLSGPSWGGRLGLPSRSGGPIPFTANGSGKDNADLWIMNPDGTDPRPFLVSPANEMEAAVSPSGKWIAYVSDETSQDEIWMEPFPGGGSRSRISQNGGDYPVWVSDSLLVFVSNRAVVLTKLEMSAGQVRGSGYQTIVDQVSSDWGLRPLDARPDREAIYVVVNTGTARLLVETDRIGQMTLGGSG